MVPRAVVVTPCPCGSGVALAACCGRYIDAGASPETPEALMRSRYTAYVLSRPLYLQASCHPRTRPERLELDPSTRWIGLTVVRAEMQDDTHGTVDFVARYRTRKGKHSLLEHSRFEKRRGAWVYIDGDAEQR